MNKRWQVEIIYNSEHGDRPIHHAIEELEELHDIVERGPNFYAIKQIRIEIDARHLGGIQTLEQSAAH